MSSYEQVRTVVSILEAGRDFEGLECYRARTDPVHALTPSMHVHARPCTSMHVHAGVLGSLGDKAAAGKEIDEGWKGSVQEFF
jgi:hypothetical protein